MKWCYTSTLAKVTNLFTYFGPYIFRKNYNTKDVMGTNSEVAANTIRKWIWKTLESIQVVSVGGHSINVIFKCTVTNIFFYVRVIGRLGL
jgi:hypothetical protein